MGGPATPRHVSVLPFEARPFQGKRAGIVSRFIANTIDLFVVLAALGGIYLGASATKFLWSPNSFHFPTPSRSVTFVVAGSILFLYLAIAWATSGRTYGDYLVGLRVVNRHCQRMNPVAAAVRSWFCIFFPIGLFWAAASSANRSVQDVVLRTSVIYDWGHGAVDGPADDTVAA